MLDKLVQGMTLGSNDFVANLKPLIETKKAQLAKSEFASIITDIEKDPEQELVITTHEQGVN